MNGKDLGTYHLRVEFEDGLGYIEQWNTGMRFTHESNHVHPLTASVMVPPWGSEDELFSTMEFCYTEGNYSCDCNRKSFLDQASRIEDNDYECGHIIQLCKLTVIRPDGTEKIIFDIIDSEDARDSQTAPRL